MWSRDGIAASFKMAIEVENFREAQRLLAEYVATVQAVWEALSPEMRRTSRVPQEANELLGWARQAVTVSRWHHGRHLNSLSSALAYYDSPKTGSWQVDA